jgi:hypothetical protein
MDNIKNTRTLPFLIHRNENAIESEKATIAEKHETIVGQLSQLKAALSDWMRKDVTNLELFEFIGKGDYQHELLRVYGEQNNVPSNVKLSKYMELYNVPSHSFIITISQSLALHPRSFLKSYVDKTTESFFVPELTEKEKAGIIEKHSIYIYTEADLRLYEAFEGLCRFINYANIESGASEAGVLLEGRIRDFILPQNLHRHIMPTQVQGHRRAPVWCIDPQKFKRF